MTVRKCLERLAAHPFELLIARWNWKSSLFSSTLRAVLFSVREPDGRMARGNRRHARRIHLSRVFGRFLWRHHARAAGVVAMIACAGGFTFDRADHSCVARDAEDPYQRSRVGVLHGGSHAVQSVRHAPERPGGGGGKRFGGRRLKARAQVDRRVPGGGTDFTVAIASRENRRTERHRALGTKAVLVSVVNLIENSVPIAAQCKIAGPDPHGVA
jgi:hypothetical protein